MVGRSLKAHHSRLFEESIISIQISALSLMSCTVSHTVLIKFLPYLEDLVPLL